MALCKVCVEFVCFSNFVGCCLFLLLLFWLLINRVVLYVLYMLCVAYCCCVLWVLMNRIIAEHLKTTKYKRRGLWSWDQWTDTTLKDPFDELATSDAPLLFTVLLMVRSH